MFLIWVFCIFIKADKENICMYVWRTCRHLAIQNKVLKYICCKTEREREWGERERKEWEWKCWVNNSLLNYKATNRSCWYADSCCHIILQKLNSREKQKRYIVYKCRYIYVLEWYISINWNIVIFSLQVDCRTLHKHNIFMCFPFHINSRLALLGK